MDGILFFILVDSNGGVQMGHGHVYPVQDKVVTAEYQEAWGERWAASEPFHETYRAARNESRALSALFARFHMLVLVLVLFSSA